MKKKIRLDRHTQVLKLLGEMVIDNAVARHEAGESSPDVWKEMQTSMGEILRQYAKYRTKPKSKQRRRKKE